MPRTIGAKLPFEVEMQRQSNLTILGVIPARLNSTRLPGKVLRDICGLPMLQYVFSRASRSEMLSDLVVATDSREVLDYCVRAGITALMTSGSHHSGTDRLHEVMGHMPADIYVNVQGDEPMIRPEHLSALLRPFFEDASVQVTTLKTPIGPEEAFDADCVKVVTGERGNALYFSRSAIPHRRDQGTSARYFKHLGIYAYSRGALDRFHRLPQTELERAERLEQLRFLEHGIPIHVVETPHNTIGVDTEGDLIRVERYFQQLDPADRL
jgi:3-deoxy-manno-octulosonate cytidylyltransferase (CMP-KDO synthetase)